MRTQCAAPTAHLDPEPKRTTTEIAVPNAVRLYFECVGEGAEATGYLQNSHLFSQVRLATAM